jgi:hypothetical protein
MKKAHEDKSKENTFCNESTNNSPWPIYCVSMHHYITLPPWAPKRGWVGGGGATITNQITQNINHHESCMPQVKYQQHQSQPSR